MNLAAFLFAAVAFAAAAVWFLYLTQTLLSVRRSVRHDEVGLRSQALLHRYHTLEADPVMDGLLRGVEEDARRTEAGGASDGEIQHEAEGARPSASADV